MKILLCKPDQKLQWENAGKKTIMRKKYSLVILETINISTAKAKAVEMSGKTAYFIPPFDIQIKYSSP